MSLESLETRQLLNGSVVLNFGQTLAQVAPSKGIDSHGAVVSGTYSFKGAPGNSDVSNVLLHATVPGTPDIVSETFLPDQTINPGDPSMSYQLSVVVNKADWQITANSISGTYNGQATTLDGTIAFQNGNGQWTTFTESSGAPSSANAYMPAGSLTYSVTGLGNQTRLTHAISGATITPSVNTAAKEWDGVAIGNDINFTTVDGTANIAKATSTLTVTDTGGPYNGSAYGATITINPADQGLTSGPDYQQYAGVTAEGQQIWNELGSNAPVNAGSYRVTAYVNATPDFNQSAAQTVYFTIAQAQANIVITPYGVTYDKQAHIATGTATGVGGADLSADLDLSATQHTNAGTYFDGYSFNDPSGNYIDASGILFVEDTIRQAHATVTVTPYSVTYDGQAHIATGTATGIGGEDLSAGLILDYVGNPSLDVPSGTVHTNAGDYSNDVWLFIDPNYTPQSALVHDHIDKAPLSITATSDTKVFDGTSNSSAILTDAANVSGLQGADTVTGLSQQFSQKYAGAEGLNIVGYTVNDGNGGQNYTVSTHAAAGTITKARLDIYATAATTSKTYDGTTDSTLTPTFQVSDGHSNVLSNALYYGSLSGLSESYNSKDVNAVTLNVDSTYVVNDGGGVGQDYNVILHSATGTISPVTVTVTVNNMAPITYGATNPLPTGGISTNYDNLAFDHFVVDPATGFTSAVSGSNRYTAGTHVVHAVLGDNTALTLGDYQVVYQTNNLVVNKRALNITATSTDKIYDGTSNANVTFTMSNLVSGDDVTIPPITNGTYETSKKVPAADVGTYWVVGTPSPTGTDLVNYTGISSLYSANGQYKITPANPNVTAIDASGPYTGSPFTATSVVKGVNNTVLDNSGVTYTYYLAANNYAQQLSGAPTQAGSYGVYAQYNGSQDYSIAGSGVVPFTISAANITIPVSTYNTTWGSIVTGLPTSYFTGINGESLSVTGWSPNIQNGVADTVGYGSYSLTPTLVANANYNVTLTPGTLNVAKAPLIVGATDQYQVYYDGFVNGDTATSLNLNPTFTTTDGTAGNKVITPVINPDAILVNYKPVITTAILTQNQSPPVLSTGYIGGGGGSNGTTSGPNSGGFMAPTDNTDGGLVLDKTTGFFVFKKKSVFNS